ncbi:MAG: ribosomal protein L7/L12 [Vagococcus sp.]|jgi:ribosomal protein L7/L12|nr:ribosomal protein L7/L12 [Vagococcus sp.]
MALIKCEECGKEISDKASSCPHCGCPLTQYDLLSKENKVYSIRLIRTAQQVKEIKAVREQLCIGLKEAKDIVDSKNPVLANGLSKDEALKFAQPFYDNGLKVEIYDQKNSLVNEASNSNISLNTPCCPKCKSRDFDMVKRNWSWVTGFMTNKVDRVCRNCKTKF